MHYYTITTYFAHPGEFEFLPWVPEIRSCYNPPLLTDAVMVVDWCVARLATALIRARFVDTDRIEALVFLLSALIDIVTGVPTAAESGFAETGIVGTQVVTLCVGVAAMALRTEVGALADHTTLPFRLNPLTRVAV